MKTTDVLLKTLWHGMTADEQEDACELFWMDESLKGDVHEETLSELARRLHFRLKYMKRRQLPERVHFLKRFILAPLLLQALDCVVRGWLLARHRKMICCFLDDAGIPHEDGLVGEGVKSPEVEKYKNSILKLLDNYDHRLVGLYIGYLLLSRDRLWLPMHDALSLASIDMATLLAPQIDEQALLEPETEEEEEEPERTDSFTTLDRMLIKTMVASALQEDYALSAEHVEHLIDEVAELNADRKHSFFHRGFFDALFKKDLTFSIFGSNEERRNWYFCGAFLGHLRQADQAKCREMLSQEKEIVEALGESRSGECGSMLLPHVYPILLADQEFDLLGSWLHNHILGLLPGDREGFLVQVYQDAARLLRRGASAEAGLLLDILVGIIRRKNLLHPRFIQQYGSLIGRKQGQAFQLEGNFPQALELFEWAVMKLKDEDAANTRTDIGLIAGNFRSLKSILPEKGMDYAKTIAVSLKEGEKHYLQAIEDHGKHATNAHFCMGVLYFIGSNSCEKKCVYHLRLAEEGMLRKQEIYSENGLLDWTRLMLGIALLESADPAYLQKALDVIKYNLENNIKFPMWLWEKVLKPLQMFDVPGILEEIALKLFYKRKDEAFDTLWSAEFYTTGELQEEFFQWLKNKKEPVFDKWDDLEKLFHAARKQGEIELCGEILDFMEVQSKLEEGCRKIFIHFLEHNPVLQPVWEESDINSALIRLYEREGDFLKATIKRRSTFYGCRDSGEIHQIQEARQIITTIQSYGVEDAHWRDLDQCLVGLEKMEEYSEQMELLAKEDLKATVLYIGGNETQENYEQFITNALHEEYPGLRCTLLFPGWNTNWGLDFDKAKRFIATADIVVINRLIRTELGKALRKYCGPKHPWIGCGGRGRESILNRIIQAAFWIRSVNPKLR